MNTPKLLTMLMTLMMVLLGGPASAESSRSLLEDMEFTVSIPAGNYSVADISSEISKQTGVAFSYSKSLAVTDIAVQNMQLKNSSIHDILKAVFSSSGIIWKIKDNMVALYLPEEVSQEGPEVQVEFKETIRGVVRDKDGNPLMGAVVFAESDPSSAVVTDIDGKYELMASKGDKVIVSLMGYAQYDYLANYATVENVVLQDDVLYLDEVIVVGYGTQKKSDITGAVASFDTKAIERRPDGQIASILQGAIPGLSINLTGSTAEATSNSEITVRGASSISASNSPLLVVDGVPYTGEWSSINSNDVASIEVLKDASSAAIYGSRGANGVILITTKRGTADKATVAYNGSVKVSRAQNIPDIMDGPTFYQRKKEAGYNFTAIEQKVYDAGQWVDWLDLCLRTGVEQEHNLSVSGRNKQTRYYISGNVLSNEGIRINDKFNRYTMRVNLEQKIGKYLTFGTNTTYGYYDRSGKEANFNQAYIMNPLTIPYNDDGTLRLLTWEDTPYAENPLSSLNIKNNDVNQRFNTVNYLELTCPIEGLSYKLNTNYSHSSRLEQTYYGQTDTQEGFANGGEMIVKNSYQTDWLIENILSYNRTFGKHTVFLTALYSAQSHNEMYYQMTGLGFQNDLNTYWQPSKAQTLTATTAEATENHISQMFRANYSYDSRYLFTATVRRDGYSAFGSDKKYGVFPSLALGWNIANEQFFKKSAAGRTVNNLKLRLSWGKNGNEGIEAYSTLPILTGKNYLDGDHQTAYGYFASTLAATDVGWETTEQYNFGLDFGLFKNRLSGSLEVYYSNTYDLLLYRTIPAINGVTSLLGNLGKTNGRGVELQLNSVNISKRNFLWSTELSLAHNKTAIADVGLFDENGTPIDDVASRWFIGYPISVCYDYAYEGVIQKDETVSYTIPSAKPGFIKYQNINGDDKVDSNDKLIIGVKEPWLVFGLTNTFSYKGFSLSIFLNGHLGATYPNYLKAPTTIEYRKNQLNHNFWTETNPTNDYPANIPDGSVNPLNASLYESTDFLRIKDINLSYRIPEKIVNRIGVNRLEVYLDAKNVYTFTSWSGLDPEFVANSSRQLSSPQTLQLSAGVRLEF